MLRKIFKFFIIALLLLVIEKSASAQTWQWAKQLSDSSTSASSTATDKNGNVYVTGTFQSSTISFDTTSVMNTGSTNVYLVKYDRLGNVLWAKTVGNTGLANVTQVCSDATGNIVVVGCFYSSMMTFGSTVLTNSNAGTTDIFIAKFNTNGTILWAKSIGGSYYDYPGGVAVDSSGDIAITGGFESASIAIAGTVFYNSSTTGGQDMFVAEFDSSGNYQWATTATGGGIRPTSIAFDNDGNVFVAGAFNNSVMGFLWSSATLINTNVGSSDLFLVSYNGPYVQRIYSAGGNGDDEIDAIATDKVGNIFAVGVTHSTSFSFPYSFLSISTLEEYGYQALFVMKFDGSLFPQWLNIAIGEAHVDYNTGQFIGCDSQDNVYTTGIFSSAYGLGIDTFSLSGVGNQDIFIVKYSNSGATYWAKSVGGSGNEQVSSISISGPDLFYLVGSTNSLSLSFSADTLNNSLGGISFVSKYNLNSPLSINSVDTICAFTSSLASDLTPGGVWISDDTTELTIDSLGIIEGLLPGIATVTYDCSENGSVKKNIFVSNLPFAGSIVSDSVLCIGSTISVSDTISGGRWLVSNSRCLIVDSLIGGMSTGIDTVYYIYSNYCGSDTAQRNLSVQFNGEEFLTGDSILCLGVGSTTTIISPITGGIWSASNSRLSISLSGVITTSTRGVDTVYYAYTNSCGSYISSKTITVNGIPEIQSIIGSFYLCVGDTTSMTDSTSGGIWNSLNENAIINLHGIVFGILPGIDTLTYSVEDICGFASTEQIISINPLPNAGVILAPDSMCIGDTFLVTATNAGGSWSISNSNAAIATSGELTAIFTGDDTIYYNIANLCGSDIASKKVFINEILPVGTIWGDTVICVGAEITLFDSTLYGNWISSNANIIVNSIGAIVGIHPGSDTISYSKSNMCGVSWQQKFIIVDSLPNAGFVYGSNTVCLYDTIHLTSSIAGGEWSISNSKAIISDGVLAGSETGNDTVYYTMSNSCGTQSVVFPVSVIAQPVGSEIIGCDSFCIGTICTFSDSVSNGFWYTSNSKAFLNSGVAIGLAPGTDTVFYSMLNACGSTTVSKQIQLFELPIVTISGSTILCVGEIDSLNVNLEGGNWIATNDHALVTSGMVGALSSGKDTIVYTLDNYCGIVRDTINIDILSSTQCDSINYVKPLKIEKNTFRIYPNPSKGLVYLDINSNDDLSYNFSISDILGRKIQSGTIACTKGQNEFEIKIYRNGIYFFELENSSTRELFKVIIQ